MTPSPRKFPNPHHAGLGGTPTTRILCTLSILIITSAITRAQSTTAPQTLADKPFLSLPGDQWKLLWNDEFNSNQLDTTKWTSGLSWSGDDGSYRHHNREYASYITDDNITFQDGNLALLTHKQDVSNPRGKIYHYTQAFIQTAGKFDYTYGYCEVRIKVPSEDGPGLWPAFWMLTKGWPPEDDVAEFWTGRPKPHTHQGFAYRDPSGKVKWDSNHKDSILPGFHTFGMEWGPGYQLFNRDGIITNTSFGRRVPSIPMYFILNSGVASAPAPTAKTIFPNAFLVDYVRIYSRPEVPAIENTSFESNTLAPWTPWNGATAINFNAHSGQHALRLLNTNSGAQQTIFGLKPLTTYRITAWVDLTGASEARLGVKNFGGPEKYTSQATPGYKQISLDFTPTADITTATLYCYKPAGAGAVFFDDIRIAPLAAQDNAH